MQDHATFSRTAVERYAARQIAAIVLAHDTRHSAYRPTLDSLDTDTRHRYEQDAAIPILLRDPAKHRPAVYAALDEACASGCLDLPASTRLTMADTIEQAIRAYHRALVGAVADPDRLRQLGLLALADLKEGGR